MEIVAVLVASGYGSLSSNGQPYPKVLENINGIPMIVRVAQVVRCAGLKNIVCVVNPLFQSEIKQTLKHYGFSFKYIVQPERRGAADAVLRGAEFFRQFGASDILSVYADMPLWSAYTISKLVELHKKQKPFVSMVTASLKNDCPNELERYGRIIRNPFGRIQKIVEVNEATGQELASWEVNPSLWMWQAEWLVKNIPLIEPCEKGDGFAPELHMPRLLSMAYQQNLPVAELALADPQEALGINTLTELEKVRQLVVERSFY